MAQGHQEVVRLPSYRHISYDCVKDQAICKETADQEEEVVKNQTGGVKDVVEHIPKQNWFYAGHILRETDKAKPFVYLSVEHLQNTVLE